MVALLNLVIIFDSLGYNGASQGNAFPSKNCVHLTFCVPSRRLDIQRNPIVSCLKLHFRDSRKSWVSFLACVNFQKLQFLRKLGKRKVHAREERKPTFPEIAEMQSETANRMVSWDSRSPPWGAKSQTDTFFEMKKCAFGQKDMDMWCMPTTICPNAHFFISKSVSV